MENVSQFIPRSNSVFSMSSQSLTWPLRLSNAMPNKIHNLKCVPWFTWCATGTAKPTTATVMKEQDI